MIKANFLGTITDLFPVEQMGNFTKRRFWVRVDDKNVFQLEAWGRDADLPNRYRDGQPVTFHVEIRGTKWSKNGREGVINSLRCIGITPQQAPTMEPQEDTPDDLPF